MGARQLELLRRWSVRPDPDNAGLDASWWQRPPADGWIACRADQAWQHTLGHDFHSVAWYRRRARLPRKWLGNGQRIRLCFRAVATECRVWVNGTEVGVHVGDYLPFEFDITDALGGSERCEIVCRVDEIRGVPPMTPGEEPWGGHITKGFHDVLGLQHGGIWGGVDVRVTGPIAFSPNGLAVHADAATGEVRVLAEFHPHEAAGELRVTLREPGTETEHTARAAIEPGQTSAELGVLCKETRLWSPETPTLGRVRAFVRAKGVPARDEAATTVAFRTVEVGGRDNRRILLNGEPLLLRGILDWGVENTHIAPAPTRDEIRDRFVGLRERGFNCVCLCMVYPPEVFYDIADETGMLLWQIHPVWKSSMSQEHMPEYRRLFDGFFHRDRRHPSVVLTSATCEHECFDEELGKWWWDRAGEHLPTTLRQVQTGFLRWSDTERMDLFDEHTYDNPGRWVCYFDDLERFLGAQPPRPFVMGETIIGTSWPDTAALLERVANERPWWTPKGLDGFCEFEQRLTGRFGESLLPRLRAQGDVFSLTLRKLQSEIFRARPHHAGWVTNHLRDVAVCQCGFLDDLDRWRFSSAQLRPFLDPCALLLRTPGFAVGLTVGERCAAEIGVSNFGGADIEGVVEVEVIAGTNDSITARVPIRASQGEVEFAPLEITPGDSARPQPVAVRASIGETANTWRLWAFPQPTPLPAGVEQEGPTPFTGAEREPDFEERRYSSGWALECSSWTPRLPDLDRLLPDAPPPAMPSDIDEHTDTTARTRITTRLTESLLSCIEHGDRVLLLASKAAGSPPNSWANLYGQVPLVLERGEGSPHGMLLPGESEWVLETLALDLNRNVCRAMPTTHLGIADDVEPVIRLIFTHDKGEPEVWDQLFFASIGRGMLAVSTLDHDNPAGRYLLRRIVEHLCVPEAPSICAGALGPEMVRAWCSAPPV